MARPRSGLRVIAGTAKGRRLETPDGLATRPVTDRVKEAVFGHLTPVVEGAAVLDLFAGSGALAIEALSRGAERGVLVEHAAPVVRLIERNLAATDLTGRAAVVRSGAAEYLERSAPEPFDLVFCDPPYEMPTPEVDELLARLGPWLAPGARVVVRRRRQSPEVTLPPGLESTRVKTYGDTVVLVAAASPNTRP